MNISERIIRDVAVLLEKKDEDMDMTEMCRVRERLRSLSKLSRSEEIQEEDDCEDAMREVDGALDWIQSEIEKKRQEDYV